MSPLADKRWRSFRRNRRAWWSLLALGVLFVFSGSIIIETIFEIPGMGRLSWDALVGRDYSVFLALLALTAGFQLIGNLLSDVLYMIIDPRIDLAKK